MKKMKTRELLAWVCLWAMGLWFAVIFLTAFFNDGHACVGVNDYGEGMLELPLVIYGYMAGTFYISNLLFHHLKRRKKR